MIYIDDRLPTHPKIYKAGALLGENGPACALALFVAAIGYARKHLTDGFVPEGFISSCGLIQTPQATANALSSRGVRLFHRVPGGYRIHDYFDWNHKASAVKELRTKERDRKRAQRAGKSNGRSGVSGPASGRDTNRPPCARGTKTKATRGTDRTNQLEVATSGVLRTTSKNKPPRCARRETHDGSKTADRNPATVRDRADRAHARSDARPVRLAREHQARSGAAGMGVGRSVDAHRCDGSRRTGDGEPTCRAA